MINIQHIFYIEMIYNIEESIKMRPFIWDTCKVFAVFLICTCLFYFGLSVMHDEYEEYHKYDEPEGPALKVFHSEERLLGRLGLFFRLGE